MAFQARIALFDNASGVERNENAPTLTGKLENQRVPD